MTDEAPSREVGSNAGLGGSWRSEPAPTHRCTVCGAVWRFVPQRDFPRSAGDTWNLRSSVAGPCCDSAPMRDQIVPLTMGDVEKILHARIMVDRMEQQVFGPDPADSVQ